MGKLLPRWVGLVSKSGHEIICRSFLDLKESRLAICKHWETSEGKFHVVL